jgi:hypothetical protein
MPTDEISQAARTLINRHIRSIDHAEAALHLASEPNQTHGADEVAARYRWSREIASRVLADLTDTGFATAIDGRFQFAPSVADAGALADLRMLYHRHPVTLVSAIYAASVPMKPLIRPAMPTAELPPGKL